MYQVYISLLLLIISADALGFRQDQYSIQVSTANSGLSQQTIHGIHQDKHDFLWLLTEGGLNRFDGYEVTSFSTVRGDESSLSNSVTRDILEDADGNIWIATLGGGLNLFNDRDLSFVALTAGNAVSSERPVSNYITSLANASENGVWIGYAQGTGFSRFDVSSSLFSHHFIPRQPPNSSIEGFVETNNSKLYVAVSNAGLYQMDLETSEIQIVDNFPSDEGPTHSISPTDVLQIDNGSLLITTRDAGAFLLDPVSGVITKHPIHGVVAPETADFLYTAYEDSEGNHWFGTNSGVAVYASANTVTWLNTFNSNLPNNEVISISQTRDGMIWLGTFSGLASGSKSLFQKFTSEDGLSSSEVNSIYAGNKNRWWIGTVNGINELTVDLDRYGDWSITKIEEQPLLPQQQVMSLTASNRKLWAGTIAAGLFEVDLQTNEVTHHDADGAAGNLSNPGVAALGLLPNGDLLVGTYGGGLNLLPNGSERFLPLTQNASPVSISDNRVISLLIDSSERVWVGTQNGLNLFNPLSSTFIRFQFDATDPSTISNNVIFSLAEDKAGNIWIGTQSGGLNFLLAADIEQRNFVFRKLEAEVNIPSSSIYAIQVDNLDNLWASHSSGLTRISADRTQSISFDERSGTQSSEFHQGASFKSANGTLFFGGANGFNTISPTLALDTSTSPSIEITSFRLLNEQVFFDRPYTDLTKIDLANDYQFASLNFASIDFQNPEAIRYRYRIDGLQNEWIRLGTTRQAFISGVPSGTYKLRINSSRPSGSWSDTERVLTINIAPPIWLTWYAYAGYAAVLAYIVYAVTSRQRRRSKLELARRIELEEKVEERTRDLEYARNEAEAATEAKSNFLAAMSHEIRTPMHGMIGMTDLLLQSGLNDKQTNFAKTAKESGRSLLEIVDSILDYSKVEAGKILLANEEFNVVDCVDNVTALLVSQAQKQNTRLLVQWTNEPPVFVVGDEGKLRQVLINLVGNAIKFTRDGVVKIVCTARTSRVLPAEENIEFNPIVFDFAIADTGIGIERQKLDSIFEVFTQADASTTREYGGTGLGLAISKELSTLMSGDLTVDSSIGAGSTFTLSIPLAKGNSAPQITDFDEKVIIALEDHLLGQSLFAKLKIAGATNILTIDQGPIEQLCADAAIAFADLKFCHDLVVASPTIKDRLILVGEQGGGYFGDDHARVISPFRIEELSRLLGAPDENKKLVSNHPGSVESNYSESAKVLLVEDVIVNQQIAGEMLSNLGASVQLATNGKIGVEMFVKERFDLVLMDCQMPVLDGYEATKQIRSIEEKNNLPPTTIIALSAGSDVDDRARAMQAGMNGFIRKPFSPHELEEVLPRAKEAPISQYLKVDALVVDSDSPVVDMNVIQNFRSISNDGQNKDLLQSLLDGFDTQFEDKLTDLSTFAEARSADNIRKAAHAIKSMSANMGALKIRARAESIELTPEEYCSMKHQSEHALFRLEKSEFVYSFEEIFNMH